MCSGLQVSGHENDAAFADPEALSWQVMPLLHLLTFLLIFSLYCLLGVASSFWPMLSEP